MKKHLTFEPTAGNQLIGEFFYRVLNNKKEFLGTVEYYKKWKCWIYAPITNIIMSASCLSEVVDFLKEKDGPEKP